MKRNIKNCLWYAYMIFVGIIFVFPVFYLVLVSFKRTGDVFSTFIFFKPTIANWLSITGMSYEGSAYAQTYDFRPFLLTSTIAASISTFLSVSLGALAAYALNRFRFRAKEQLAFFILTLRMMPPIVGAVALYLLFVKFNLTDSIIMLGLAYTVFNLPFTIWILRGFFQDIPREIDESALVDGCNWLGIFLRIILPLTKPGLAVAAILTFIFSWNEFLLGLVLMHKNMPVPVAITQFITAFELQYGPLSAAAVTGIIPVVIFTLVVRKHILRGLTLGAVKG